MTQNKVGRSAQSREPEPQSREPVAWANEDDDGLYDVGLSEGDAHRVLERAQAGKLAHRNPRIVPLYRQPTLTDAEREAIKAGIANCEDITYGGPNDEEAAAVLRRLLERLG